MGGKWTSYRAMGEETIDEILVKHPIINEQVEIKPRTIDFNLLGSYE